MIHVLDSHPRDPGVQMSTSLKITPCATFKRSCAEQKTRRMVRELRGHVLPSPGAVTLSWCWLALPGADRWVCGMGLVLVSVVFCLGLAQGRIQM